MMLIRIKYYIGWKTAQSTVTFCGLSYNPTTSIIMVNDKEEGKIFYNRKVITNHFFDKNENCTMAKIELEINPKIRIQVKYKNFNIVLE